MMSGEDVPTWPPYPPKYQPIPSKRVLLYISSLRFRPLSIPCSRVFPGLLVVLDYLNASVSSVCTTIPSSNRSL